MEQIEKSQEYSGVERISRELSERIGRLYCILFEVQDYAGSAEIRIAASKIQYYLITFFTYHYSTLHRSRQCVSVDL